MSEERKVSLDEVGSAEDLLRRLIQERRLLENAANVLQTYRSVLSQLQPVSQELANVRAEVVEAQRSLSAVEEQRRVSLGRVEHEVNTYRERMMKEVSGEIEQVRKDLEKIKAEKGGLDSAYASLNEKYKEEEGWYKKEIDELSEQLDNLRKEHGALAEAISRAAQYFKK